MFSVLEIFSSSRELLKTTRTLVLWYFVIIKRIHSIKILHFSVETNNSKVHQTWFKVHLVPSPAEQSPQGSRGAELGTQVLSEGVQADAQCGQVQGVVRPRQGCGSLRDLLSVLEDRRHQQDRDRQSAPHHCQAGVHVGAGPTSDQVAQVSCDGQPQDHVLRPERHTRLHGEMRV